MSFDYDKIREKEEHANWWTSYADLWSMLSIVFLVMYVSASLHTGAQGVQQQIELQQVEKKNEELQEQLRVYGTLRDETLQHTSEKEQEVYKQLMDKLSLLKEDAKNEKNELRKKAQENEQKEFALNQYQQIVRNIIDTNVLAKASIQNRDRVIGQKTKTIAEKQAEISSLNQEVQVREKTIAQNENRIHDINARLDGQIQKLQQEEQKANVSKVAMNKMIERLRSDSAKKVQAIQAENEEARAQMSAELERTKQTYVSQLQNMRAENESKLAEERHAFDVKLSHEKISAAAKAKKLEAFKHQAELRAQQLEGALSGISAKVKDTEAQLSAAQAEKGRALASLEATEAENAALGEKAAALARQKRALAGEVERTKGELEGAKGELAGTKGELENVKVANANASRSLAQAEADKANLSAEKNALGSELKQAKELLAVKKRLIQRIQNSFAKQGIKAQVDKVSGDVTLDFGEEYFDTGSARLKPKMIEALKKLFPTYSRSLFEDSKTAEKIANIEIIGFASSTYKGRYVNPSSLKPENQEAINYNLKLSFNRANAIFKYIFDPSKLKYEDQKRLLGMVKVVGRGFLPNGKEAKDMPEEMPESTFCAQYNCKKAQRVIVKFNLKE